MIEVLHQRWRPQEFPSRAVSEAFRKLARESMLKNWFDTYGDKPSLAIEQYFEFEFEGVTVLGYIDRIGPAVQDGTVITDYKTGKSDNAGPPQESLQLGIYYLAVQDSDVLADYQPVRTVELAFLRGNWRRSDAADFRKLPITERDEETYEAGMRERLASLIARKKELNETEVFRPNPYANCRFCDFQTLCPAVCRRPARVPRRAGPSGSAGMSVTPITVPGRDRRRHGRRAAHRRTVGRHLHAASAVRAGGRRGVGQDQRHGRARGLPRARRPRSYPARRQPGRAAGQRAVPHLHRQGHGEPAEPGAPGPGRHRPARGRGATDRELPRHGGPGAGSLRHPRPASNRGSAC
jgi:hypothetical protein